MVPLETMRGLLTSIVAGTLLLTGCRFDASGLSTPGADVEAGPDLDRRDAVADLLDAGPPTDLDAASDDAGDLTTDAGADLTADQGPDAGPPLSKLGPDDGRLWLGIKTAAKVALLSWDEKAASWIAETNLPLPTGEVRWVQSGHVPGKTGFELVLFKLEVSGKPALEAFALDSNNSWQQRLYIAAAGGELGKRDVGMALEHTSNDRLLVYSDGTERPQYVISSGVNTWSAPKPVPINDGSGPGPDLTSGNLLWIELVVDHKKGSDQIALLFVDDQDDLAAIIWDGSAWDSASAKLVSSNVTDNTSGGLVTQRAFDGAFERKSGDLLLAWGDGGKNGFRYCTRSAGGSWSSDTQVSAPSSGETDFVDLAENPRADSDLIAAALVDLDGTERLGLATWDGDTWVGAKEYDSQIRNINNKAEGDFPAAVGWVGASSEAVCVYSDDQTGKLDWYNWKSGDWKAGGDLSIAGKGYTESVLVRSYGGQDRLLVVLSDSNAKVYSATYDGKTFKAVSSPATLTSQLSGTNTLPFSLWLKP